MTAGGEGKMYSGTMPNRIPETGWSEGYIARSQPFWPDENDGGKSWDGTTGDWRKEKRTVARNTDPSSRGIRPTLCGHSKSCGRTIGSRSEEKNGDGLAYGAVISRQRGELPG